MPKNENSSHKLASLAARALKDPKGLTPTEIQSLAGCVLTQVEDQPKAKPRKR